MCIEKENDKFEDQTWMEAHTDKYHDTSQSLVRISPSLELLEDFYLI